MRNPTALSSGVRVDPQKRDGGDPRAASADKGARFAEAVVRRIAGFLVDLAAADPADLYE